MTIRIPYDSSILRVLVNGEIYDRFGDNVSVTIRIPYNNGISGVCVNGETPNRFGDKITPCESAFFGILRPKDPEPE